MYHNLALHPVILCPRITPCPIITHRVRKQRRLGRESTTGDGPPNIGESTKAAHALRVPKVERPIRTSRGDNVFVDGGIGDGVDGVDFNFVLLLFSVPVISVAVARTK